METLRDEDPPSCVGDETSALRSAKDGIGAVREGVLLVPTDFTDESGYALKHAQRIGKSMGLPVVMLHVLEGNEKEEAVLERMEEQAEEICGRWGDIEMRVARGAVSEQIPRVAEEVNAEYVVLGSRDVKIPGHHKISTSLKLLGHGRIPYITVQELPDSKRYENIVFPIDYTDENQQRFDWLDRLCRYHSPTFHLVRPSVNEPELVECVDENMARAMAVLSLRGTPYTVRTMPGEADYALEILEVAHELEADLIVVTTSIDPRRKGSYMLEPHERRLVLQAADIPVMSINPE